LNKTLHSAIFDLPETDVETGSSNHFYLPHTMQQLGGMINYINSQLANPEVVHKAQINFRNSIKNLAVMINCNDRSTIQIYKD